MFGSEQDVDEFSDAILTVRVKSFYLTQPNRQSVLVMLVCSRQQADKSKASNEGSYALCCQR